MEGLNKVVVSEDKQSVTVQGGALWGDVYEETQKFGLDVVGAFVWFIGVAGSLSGGGYGRLSAEYGLALDNLLSATVVLADGRTVKTSANEEPDLFWAIRGVCLLPGFIYKPPMTFKFRWRKSVWDCRRIGLEDIPSRANHHHKFTDISWK